LGWLFLLWWWCEKHERGMRWDRVENAVLFSPVSGIQRTASVHRGASTNHIGLGTTATWSIFRNVRSDYQ
jgi:hypothetical protein